MKSGEQGISLRYSLLASRYSQFAIRYSRLAIRNSQFVIRSLPPPRVEALVEPAPAFSIVALARFERGRVPGDPLAEAGLEHEGKRVLELHRRERGLAGAPEGVAVGAVRQHLVVQAHAARHEALGLGVVDAVNQPHEFRHDVAVVPGRPEGILGDLPAGGK